MVVLGFGGSLPTPDSPPFHNADDLKYRDKLEVFCAGYEIHCFGPKYIWGILISNPGNDAVCIDELKEKIDMAKEKLAKDFPNDIPKLWFIGDQT